MKGVMRFVAIVALACVSPAQADDVDGDGVDNSIDVCDNTPPGTAVDAEGRPLGDVDQDCDTDLEDHALFQQGFTGPLIPTYIVIDTVRVGNPGNANDTHGDGYGWVAYTYNVGKYEVTAGQYCVFLNAVAREDTYGLYDPRMWVAPEGCKIERTGSYGSYTYSVAGDWADRPVNYVSWGDAARFANWLHNDQPAGAQDVFTTEYGSYYLNGATSAVELLAVDREPDATWVIPSEAEWYKAAYHKNDGVTGNYWDYPTQSETVPTSEAPPGTDMTDGSANYFDQDAAIGGPYYRTEVGAYDAKPSDSPYGTFDQGGNVWEWNEAAIASSRGLSARGLRGGSYGYEEHVLRASNRDWYDPTHGLGHVGFRVATGPFALPDIVIDTVPVGNPGASHVAYTYNIGKYEVTAGQYCAFLNAVAGEDTYGLYNPAMWTSDYGCKIEQTGSYCSSTYSVAGDWADRPVNYVSWGDAARFANWLHNGQPAGAQDVTTTEDGSYYLNGATSDAELMAVEREPDATWVIPSNAEWGKAAFHKNDGVTSNYWLYPTQSDTVPTSEAPPGTDMTNGSANYCRGVSSCIGDDGYAIGSPYYRTEVGAYDAKPSDSPYGTFDQGGNVLEWTEFSSGDARGLHGGSYNDIWAPLMNSQLQSRSPWVHFFHIGFRVVEIP